jgi:hypothetical protein
MISSSRVVFIAALSLFVFGNLSAEAAGPPPQCKKFKIKVKASEAFASVTLPPSGGCSPKESRGHPIPDPSCSPGAVNPTLTLKLLKTKGFTTKCVRNMATTPAQKARTYTWYNIPKPKNNSGKTMTCELDHIVSLQLGGADTLNNLWPQCGPNGVPLPKRHFKLKDDVENYIARQIKAGALDMKDAQRRIAEDWTQFLDVALAAKKGPKKN